MTMVALWVTFSSITVFLSSFLTTFKSSVVMAAMAAETEAATDSAAEALVSAPLSRLRFLPADDDVVLVVFLPERRALVDAAAPPFFLPPPLDLAGFFDPLDLVAVVFFLLVLAAAAVLVAAFLLGRALAATALPLVCLAPFFLVGAMVAGYCRSATIDWTEGMTRACGLNEKNDCWGRCATSLANLT